MTTRVFRYAGRDWPDPRNTWAWRALRDRVVAEEPLCWLRYPDLCTTVSTTADHVIPIRQRPDLGMDRANLRGACRPCNNHRKDRPPPTPQPRPRALDVFFGPPEKSSPATQPTGKPAADLPPSSERAARGSS